MSEFSDIESFSAAHFVGIGGAGMSGIALVLHERGVRVTGSDLKASHYVAELGAGGIDVHIGHDAATIDEVKPDVIVISSAIPETNPEVIRARELGIPVWPRAKMLSWLSRSSSRTVAVAGTHGKTTTSSMVATMLDRMGLDPSFLIGGIVEGYDTNGRNGSGEHFVCEADESDGSFLFLDPHMVVVTNVEADHLDHYGTLENIQDTFVKFMSLVDEDGCAVVCGEDPTLPQLAARSGRRFVTYGFGEDCDYTCAMAPAAGGLATAFTVSCPDGRTVEVTIKANPGRHNVLNATASLAVAAELGLDVDEAARALSTFEGARRRFTHIGEVAGVNVVDDYGHHPTEIAATLAAARSLDFKRVRVIFQPHRYSRTSSLLDQFAHAFDDADELFVMDIFAAGELAIPGVTGRAVARCVKKARQDMPVSFEPNRHKLVDTIAATSEPGDIVITMGAGDVTALGPLIVEALEERAQDGRA